MPNTFRTDLIRLASTLPKGSEERRALLAELGKEAAGLPPHAIIQGKMHLFYQLQKRNPKLLEILDEMEKSMPMVRRSIQQWKEGTLPKGDHAMVDVLWTVWDKKGLLEALMVNMGWKPNLRAGGSLGGGVLADLNKNTVWLFIRFAGFGRIHTLVRDLQFAEEKVNKAQRAIMDAVKNIPGVFPDWADATAQPVPGGRDYVVYGRVRWVKELDPETEEEVFNTILRLREVSGMQKLPQGV